MEIVWDRAEKSLLLGNGELSVDGEDDVAGRAVNKGAGGLDAASNLDGDDVANESAGAGLDGLLVELGLGTSGDGDLDLLGSGVVLLTGGDLIDGLNGDILAALVLDDGGVDVAGRKHGFER